MPPGGPWQPAGEQLGDEPPRRGPRTLIIGLAVVLVLALGGGAWAALSFWTGDGGEPADALPDEAIAYFRLDLNPSGEQQTAIYNLIKKFPEANKKFEEGDGLRKSLFEAIKEDSDELKDVDYAEDVEPWLGERLGVAMLPSGGDEPGVAVGLAITDEDSAQAGLEKLFAKDKDDVAWAFTESGDYAIFSDTQANADKYATQGSESPLSQNETYTDDMNAVGENGVMSFWMDQKKMMEAVGDEASLDGLGMAPGSAATTGRTAGALRVDGDAIELAGVTRGVQNMPELGDAKGVKLGDLPDTTAAALSVAGAGPALDQNWDQILSSINQIPQAKEQFELFINMARQEYNLAIPDDVVTLLGDELTVALDEGGLAEAIQGGGQTMPKVGLRSTTDVAKGEAVVDKIQALLASQGAPLQLGKATGDGTVAVALDQAYADQLVQGGTLGDSETFRAAVPDADNAQFGIYVDLDKLEPLYLAQTEPDVKANVEPLSAIGVSGTTTADGGDFTLRLLTN